MRGQCRIFSTVGLGSACVCEDLSSRVQKTEGRAVETEFQAHGHCWGQTGNKETKPKARADGIGQKDLLQQSSHLQSTVGTFSNYLLLFCSRDV